MQSLLSNPEAERALIGLAISFPDTLPEIAAMDPELFSRYETRAVHGTIREMVAHGTRQLDMITLATEVAKKLNNPEAFLMECSSAGLPSMLGQYKAILNDCKQRRTVVSAAKNIATYENDPRMTTDEMIASMNAAATLGQTTEDTMTSGEALETMLDNMRKAKERIVTTGIPDLDRVVKITPKTFVIIAARPSIGKSAIATQIAVNIAEKHGPVLYVCYEMGPEENMARIVANLAGVSASDMLYGEASDDELLRASKEYQRIANMPLRMSQKARTPLKIRQLASAMKAKEGLAAIVVDYIQQMHPDEYRANENENIAACTGALKEMAMDLDVPVIALGQFNRLSEAGVNGKSAKVKPDMSQFKGSGAAEQDANIFLTLWEPAEPTNPDSAAYQTYHYCQANGLQWRGLAIEKNRNSRTGVIYMYFDGPHMRFGCIDTRLRR